MQDQDERVDDSISIIDSIPDIGIALDSVAEFSSSITAGNWTDHKSTAAFGLKNHGYHKMWNQYKTELQHIKGELTASFGPGFTVEDIWSIFFGRDELIYKVFHESFNWSYESFLKFHVTFYTGCMYHMSTTKLFDPRFGLVNNEMMELGEYKEAWYEIATFEDLGCPFWPQLEKAFNDIARRLFVVNFPSDKQRVTTFDDDKVHFSCRNSEVVKYCLKLLRHTRDNIDGLVCHVAGFSALGVITQICWHRDSDTTETAMERLITSMLSPMRTPGQGLPRLPRDTFELDRGYWSKHTLIDLILPSCATVLGTIKRLHIVPFCYDTKLKMHDRREDVPSRGHKDLRIKHLTTANNVKLSCAAFRSGTGQVSLAISSEYHDLKWDFVLKNPAHRATWFNELEKDTSSPTDDIDDDNSTASSTTTTNLTHNETRYLDCFPKWSGGTVTDPSHRHALLGLRGMVDALTYEPDNAEWFILRSYAFTSSTVDLAIQYQFEASRRDGTLDDLDTSWDTIAGILGLKFDEAAAATTLPLQAVKDPATVLSDAEFIALDTSEKAKYIVLMVNGADASNQAKLFLNQLRSGETFDEALLQETLSFTGFATKDKAGIVKSVTKLQSVMETYLTANNDERQYCLLNSSQLSALVKQRGIKNSKGYLSTNEKRVEALVKDDKNGNDEDDHTERRIWKTPMLAVLKSTFMPALVGKGKEYCKRGKHLEPLYAERLIAESRRGETLFQISDLYRPPLVAKSGGSWFRDTADYIGIFDEPSMKNEVFVVEMKGRLAPSTLQKERTRRLLLNTRLNDDRKYARISITDERIRDYVESKHELIQIIHHATMYEVKFVLLLIGNWDGVIEAGIWVEFDLPTQQDYLNVLQDLYLSTLQWIYEPKATAVKCPSDSELLRMFKEMKGMDVTMESFQRHVALFKVANKMDLPIPPCARIIPVHHAVWNPGKHVSDTKTKMIDSLDYDVPSNARTGQSEATARMLLYDVCQIHSLLQVLSTKSLNNYSSLQSCRQAANQRRSFKDTMIDCIEILRAKVRDESSKPPLPDPVVAMHHGLETPRRRPRRQRDKSILEVDFIEITGNTPRTKSSRRQHQEGLLCAEATRRVLHRMQKCPGIPMYRLSHENPGNLKAPGARSSCAVCGKDTHWWCAGCHIHACYAPTKRRRTSSSTSGTKLLKVDDKNIFRYEGCWHERHLEGMKMYFEGVKQPSCQPCDHDDTEEETRDPTFDGIRGE